MSFEKWWWRNVGHTPDGDAKTADIASSAWDAATLVERERCVKLAEAHVCFADSETEFSVLGEAQQNIAAAIRGQDAQ